MQNNSQNQGQKFVERFEMAIMQFVILNKAKQGGVTKDNLLQTFRGNLQMQGNHLDHCIRQLVSDGHLKEEGNRYTITDDGREDVQKLQHLVIELPGIVGGQGGVQTQKPGMTQSQTVGGQGNVQGNYGGQTLGNQGNVGSSSRGEVGNTQQGTMNQGSVNKGGATSPSGQGNPQNKGNR
jgi:predicted transcriptional regulator